MHTPAEAGQRKVDRVAPQVAIDSPIGRPSGVPRFAKTLGVRGKSWHSVQEASGRPEEWEGDFVLSFLCQVGFCARAFRRHALPIYSLRKTTPDTPCRRSIYSPLLGSCHSLPRFTQPTASPLSVPISPLSPPPNAAGKDVFTEQPAGFCRASAC